LADRVVDDVDTPPVCEFACAFLEILCAVEDHVVRAGFARQRRFFFRSTRRNHAGAGLLQHLDEESPGSSGGRMNERNVAGVRVAHAMGETVSSHALQQAGGGELGRQRVWNADQSIHRCHTV
jgi:hypothetical protein